MSYPMKLFEVFHAKRKLIVDAFLNEHPIYEFQFSNTQLVMTGFQLELCKCAE